MGIATVLVVFVVMVFILVKLEFVVCQPATNTENSTSGCDLHEIQRQLQLLLQQFKSFQQQVHQQSELIEQLQNQIHNCGTEPTVRYYDLQFHATPLVNRRSRDQLVCELKSICNPLLIQQNVDGSNFFDRTWEEYKVGFNDSNGNYWLGNELLHQLTMNNTYKLRFDLQSRDNNSLWFWVEYSTFIVGSETTNYTLQVGGFSGNVYIDALSSHNRMQFTTKDRDNDKYSDLNCALRHVGGFWYNNCGLCSINAGNNGYYWYWDRLIPSYYYLQTSRMWLICR